MKDITYCSSVACPSEDCKIKLKNIDIPVGTIISMADFSGTCRFYIGWILSEIEDDEL